MKEEVKRQLFEEIFNLQLQQIKKYGAEEKPVPVIRAEAIIEAFWQATKSDDQLYSLLADKKKAGIEEAKENNQNIIAEQTKAISDLDKEIAKVTDSEVPPEN